MSVLNITSSASSAIALDKENLTIKSTQVNENKISKQPVKQDPSVEEDQLVTAGVSHTIAELNALFAGKQLNLSFSVDEQSGESIITVTDSETDEMIKQIPSEELMVLRKKMDDITGILFNKNV